MLPKSTMFFAFESINLNLLRCTLYMKPPFSKFLGAPHKGLQDTESLQEVTGRRATSYEKATCDGRSIKGNQKSTGTVKVDATL